MITIKPISDRFHQDTETYELSKGTYKVFRFLYDRGRYSKYPIEGLTSFIDMPRFAIETSLKFLISHNLVCKENVDGVNFYWYNPKEEFQFKY